MEANEDVIMPPSITFLSECNVAITQDASSCCVSLVAKGTTAVDFDPPDPEVRRTRERVRYPVEAE